MKFEKRKYQEGKRKTLQQERENCHHGDIHLPYHVWNFINNVTKNMYKNLSLCRGRYITFESLLVNCGYARVCIYKESNPDRIGRHSHKNIDRLNRQQKFKAQFSSVSTYGIPDEYFIPFRKDKCSQITYMYKGDHYAVLASGTYTVTYCV